MKKFTLHQNLFRKNGAVEISLPDDWDVSFHGLAGDTVPALSQAEIRKKLNSPYGMKPLGELARGRREAVIVFDDNSRGTPVQPMAEAVLEELHAAGIGKDHIRFLCALGTHGANNRRDFAAKLGERIVRNYRVYNHNCYENCVSIGKTKSGVDVCINGEFMACDLKIGLGGITPHVFNAFGGGGKLLFPGIASLDCIYQNHHTAIRFLKEKNYNTTDVMGNLCLDGMRNEIEEMTKLAGEFFKVDCIYNSKLELIDLYSGDPVEEYYAAIPAAQKFYAITRPKDRDVVIVNANAKATEASIAVSMAAACLGEKGGDVVLIDHTDIGQVTHYLFGCFGDSSGGRMCARVSADGRSKIQRIICNVPYPEPASAYWYGEKEKQVYVDTWDDVLALLADKYKAGTKAAVIADATISYFGN